MCRPSIALMTRGGSLRRLILGTTLILRDLATLTPVILDHRATDDKLNISDDVTFDGSLLMA